VGGAVGRGLDGQEGLGQWDVGVLFKAVADQAEDSGSKGAEEVGSGGGGVVVRCVEGVFERRKNDARDGAAEMGSRRSVAGNRGGKERYQVGPRVEGEGDGGG
jgi:hypothetical protein